MTDCLADQARGCDHDPSDECSYAAIQQDFMKDVGHDTLQLRYTLTKRWPQSVRKLITSTSFFTSRLRVARLQQQIETLFSFPYWICAACFPSTENDLCARANTGLSTTGPHWRF